MVFSDMTALLIPEVMGHVYTTRTSFHVKKYKNNIETTCGGSLTGI